MFFIEGRIKKMLEGLQKILLIGQQRKLQAI